MSETPETYEPDYSIIMLESAQVSFTPTDDPNIVVAEMYFPDLSGGLNAEALDAERDG